VRKSARAAFRHIVCGMGPALLIVLVGIAVSSAAFILARRSDDAGIRAGFELRAEWRARDFERKLAVSVDSLQSLALVISLRSELSADEFQQAARLGHDQDDVNNALVWAPLVRAADRDAFVERHRAVGGRYADFEIRERQPDGSFAPEAARAEYMPSLFEEDFGDEPGVAGLDLLSLPERGLRAEKARDAGSPIATPPLPVFFSPAERRLGFLVFWPVYSTIEVPSTAEARRAAFRGVAISRYHFDRLLPALIANTPEILESIDVLVDRGRDDAAPMAVARYDPAQRNFVVGSETGAEDPPGVNLTREFSIFGRRWTLRSNFSPELLAAQRSLGPWAWLLFGLALTGLLAAYVERERLARRGVEELVAERTADLTAVNENLRRETAVRTQAEITLRRSEERFRRIYEESPVGIVLGEADTRRIIQANPAFAGMLGYTPDQLIGRRVDEMLPPGEPTSAEIASREGMRNWRAVERRYLNAAGDVVWVRASTTLLTEMDGGVPLALGVAEDITQRKRAEARLSRTEERLRRIYEDSPLGVVIAEPETTRILQVNQAFAQMLGYSPEELAGRPINELLAPEESRLTETAASRSAPKWSSYERRYLTKSGKIAWARISVSLISEPDGTSVALGVSEDITARKLTEQQLIQAQKMEAVGNLTGGMAHDFNNLLGVIIGNLDLAQPLVKAQGEAELLIGEALHAALRGAELTRRLLAFARQQPLQPERINVNELVSGMVRLLSRTLGEQVEVSLELAPDVWSIVADPAQLEASLANLATNARDAMPRGGILRIATGNRSLDADYAAEHHEMSAGDYAMIKVTDTGMGMPPEVLKRIFEPFFTTKEHGKGTGLGLAMVFGFMKQSGGHINVYSEVGMGTTFRLYLPRAPAAKDVEMERPAAAEPHGAGETVLVVEDNEALRFVVMRQLLELGYHPIESDGADAALKELETQKIDLVLSDVVMPGSMDGFALAELARERWPGLKVVLTSGFPGDSFGEARDAAAGAVRILSKPYRKEDLARSLRAALDA